MAARLHVARGWTLESSMRETGELITKAHSKQVQKQKERKSVSGHQSHSDPEEQTSAACAGGTGANSRPKNPAGLDMSCMWAR